MRIYFKFILYLAVAIGFSSAKASSYEDFFRAVLRDDARTVQGLLQRGFDPNTPNPDGQHGLFLALREGADRVAQVLVEWPQTRVEHRNAADESPLMMAALKGRLAFVRRLVERDADVNKTGWTPLHYAATGGHTDVIQFLLDAHAYIDAESPNGSTPLMMAAMYGSEAAVKLLLEAGADASLKNQLGLSAQDFAQRANRPVVVDMITRHQRRGQPAGTW